MMTDEQILQSVEYMSFACLYALSTKLGPGRDRWRYGLARLTAEQRMALIRKLERWQELRLRVDKDNTVLYNSIDK